MRRNSLCNCTLLVQACGASCRLHRRSRGLLIQPHHFGLPRPMPGVRRSRHPRRHARAHVSREAKQCSKREHSPGGHGCGGATDAQGTGGGDGSGPDAQGTVGSRGASAARAASVPKPDRLSLVPNLESRRSRRLLVPNLKSGLIRCLSTRRRAPTAVTAVVQHPPRKAKHKILTACPPSKRTRRRMRRRMRAAGHRCRDAAEDADQ